MAFHLKAPQGFGNRLSKALSSSLGEGLGRYQESQNRQTETKNKILGEEAADVRRVDRIKKGLGSDEGLDLAEISDEKINQIALYDPKMADVIRKNKKSTQEREMLDRLLKPQEPQEGEKAPQMGGRAPIDRFGKEDLMQLLAFPGPIADVAQARIDDINKKEEVERKPLEKSAENFFTKLQEDQEKIPELELSVDAMTDAVNRGDVDPFSSGHLAEIATAFGVPESLTRVLQTPGSKEFTTARKTFLASTLKDSFKGTTSSKEIDLADSLLAQIGVNPNANKAALGLLKSNLLIRQEKQRLAKEAQQKGISNYKVQDYVNEHIINYRKNLSKQYMQAIKEWSKK